MSSLKNILNAAFLLLIVGCSQIEPFVDRRRNAGADFEHLYIGRSRPASPAICYNGLWTSEEKLQEMADAECQKHGTGTHAEFVEKTILSCKLLLPSHAYYQCIQE